MLQVIERRSEIMNCEGKIRDFKFTAVVKHKSFYKILDQRAWLKIHDDV